MKKLIEKYIEQALKGVDTHLHPDKDGKVYAEYDGYAAALGAAIITSGLQPALAFYTDVHKDAVKNNQPQARRWRILAVIAQILKTEEKWAIDDKMANALLKYVIEHKENSAELRMKILAASIAVKLALRNYEHVKSPASDS